MTVTQVLGPGEWLGAEIRDSDAWRVRLDEAHRREVLEAVRAVEAGETPPDDFPLPTLGPVLGRVREELANGRGFVLVQGVPTGAMTERQCEIAALGLGRHVGGVVPQGPDQAPLMHVRDTGADPAQARTKSYQHSGRLGYHSDPTDVVALLCLRPAKSGGLSAIVSSVAVHNELVRTRPDLAALLYEPWWHDRRTGDGPDSFSTKPICVPRDGGGVSVSYGPDYLRSAQRGAHVPPFTPAQEEAMDLLDRLTNDARFALTMDLREGDMQLLNNHVVLHSRTAYDDHPEPERRRHLLRLWLATDPPH
ncbi:TfdA family taurine catabolism dioxygenase TauD [Nonomuraea polychroma]|uniref:TfdA family taurine catabolism dioxygenase TauD n=1 Tax=Nonomuraea polychroma TaxID=46176 RepID=A0A438M4V9_9ACTN|nr:TauD/TfdA family dioxygenase [Nonomuraea polychroma]RVX40849.1 TfdA family taurine catabolism dioxygenase TauD [Nonomuraea polychroma]